MKKAIVTGASSGIGESISRMLLKNGYEVWGIGRDFSKNSMEAKLTADEHERFHQVVCDLANGQELVKCIENINKDHDIELLVNNAGVGYYGLHEELNVSKIHELVAVNLEAPMLITNMLLRDLKKNHGTIVFISSVTATEVNPHGCAYGATKAGLTSFAHSIFAEARKCGVRVFNIQPDMTATRLYRNADFECDSETEAALRPEDVSLALDNALNMRNGAVITDITLVPQLHRIKRKHN